MKNSFVLYYNTVKSLEMLTDRELGKVFKALIKYETEGVLPDFKDRILLMSFTSLKEDADFNKIRYDERCVRNKKAAESRWSKEKELQKNADVCECIPTDAKNADKDKEKDKVKDNDKEYVYVKDNECMHPQKRDAQKENTYKPSAEKTEGKGDFFSQKEQLYGLFKNVRLLPAEYQQLKNSFPDADKRIEELSAYISSSGKSYENHFAKLTQWVSFAPTKKEKPREKSTSYSDAAYDIDKYMHKAFNLESPPFDEKCSS